MWHSCLASTGLALLALAPLSSAAPSPLTTTASTLTTMEGPNSDHSGLLIHVLRTEDLVADKIKNKPLLLEKLSHLIIRVELGNDTVSVNGHSLPVLSHNPHDTLRVAVKLEQVQMLKMPKNSPLVPLGLTKPELLKLSNKYMSEGLVGAMLSVKQEPLIVQAIREDGVHIDAKAFKVTIAIKILELDGVQLERTNLPAVDLLHLIVHPDPKHPSKVATMTTVAPPQLSGSKPAPAVADPISQATSALKNLLPHGSASRDDLLRHALEASRASLAAALGSFGHAMGHFGSSLSHASHSAAHRLASHASHLLEGVHHTHRKPCHRPRPSHKAIVSSAQLAAIRAAHQAVHGTPARVNKHAHESVHGAPEQVTKHAHGSSFSRTLACLIKTATRSSVAVLLLGLPLLLVSLLYTVLRPKVLEYRKRKCQQQATSGAIDSKEVEQEKLLEGEEDVEKV